MCSVKCAVCSDGARGGEVMAQPICFGSHGMTVIYYTQYTEGRLLPVVSI